MSHVADAPIIHSYSPDHTHSQCSRFHTTAAVAWVGDHYIGTRPIISRYEHLWLYAFVTETHSYGCPGLDSCCHLWAAFVSCRKSIWAEFFSAPEMSQVLSNLARNISIEFSWIYAYVNWFFYLIWFGSLLCATHYGKVSALGSAL